jgi:hypothetical protein
MTRTVRTILASSAACSAVWVLYSYTSDPGLVAWLAGVLAGGWAGDRAGRGK